MLGSLRHRSRRVTPALDELVQMPSADRRRAADDAVASGVVGAYEAEDALRLAARLDAIRVMTVPARAYDELDAVLGVPVSRALVPVMATGDEGEAPDAAPDGAPNGGPSIDWLRP